MSRPPVADAPKPARPGAGPTTINNARALCVVIACVVRGSSSAIEPLPIPPPAPTHEQWPRFYKLPNFIRNVVHVLKEEAVRPHRLRNLFDLGIHNGGRIGRDDQFQPRQRRRRMSHWVSLMRLVAGMVCLMDIRSRYLATPDRGELHVRDWEDVFNNVFGERVHDVLGMSRLERATKLLRKLGWFENFRIHISEDGGETFRSRPSFKRVGTQLFEALGMLNAYRAERDRVVGAVQVKQRKEARKAARKQRREQERQGFVDVRDLVNSLGNAPASSSTSGGSIEQQRATPGQGPPAPPDAVHAVDSGSTQISRTESENDTKDVAAAHIARIAELLKD